METNVAKDSLQTATDLIDSIEAKLKTLQTGFLKNVRDANEVKSEAKTLVQEVEDTKNKASKLVDDYNNATSTLKKRESDLNTTNKDSRTLFERASQLLANTTSKLKELEGKPFVMIAKQQVVNVNIGTGRITNN